MANVDYFLKLDGIDGESTDAQFPNWIQLISWSWGATQMTNASNFGGKFGGAGNVTVHDLSMTAAFSAASPSLFNYCTSGKHINTAELDCRKAGDPPQVYMKLKLTDVFVASYHTTGSETEHPIDRFTLQFAKVEMCYGCQNADGKVNSLDKKAMWDLRTNKSS